MLNSSNLKHGWAATPSHIKTQGTASGTTHSFLTIHGYSVGLSESQVMSCVSTN